MTLIVDERHLGTSEAAWLSSAALGRLRPLTPIGQRRVVLVAPHPDDEIFGAAGLLMTIESSRVHIVAVTDGEASHPPQATASRDLGVLRATESAEALRRLGQGQAPVTRLGLPDGAVADHGEQLARHLDEIVAPDDLCVAPWRHDGHPDHDACGRAAAEVTGAKGAPLLEYLVWAWHWLGPEDPLLPWGDAAVLALSRRQAAQKRWATHAFASQIRPFGRVPHALTLLPAPVLRRFWRPFEVFIEGGRP